MIFDLHLSIVLTFRLPPTRCAYEIAPDTSLRKVRNCAFTSLGTVEMLKVRGGSYVYAKTHLHTHLNQEYGKILAVLIDS